MNTVSCPHCAMHVANDGTLAGQVVSCPRCRRQFQMPPSVPKSEALGAFEDLDDTPHRPRRRRGSQAGLAVGAIIVAGLVAVTLAGLWTFGVIQFKLPPGGTEQQAKKATAEDGPRKRQPENERPQAPQGKKDKAQPVDSDEKASELAEDARKRAAEDAWRQNQIDQLLAELDQQAKKDIAEIDQRLTSYRNAEARWEQRTAALEQDPRFGDPFNPTLNAEMNALNQESQALQADLRSINRLIDEKQRAFNLKRESILQRFSQAALPTWETYYRQSR